MGYYNFPHTRNYDTDLGYLIDWFKTNKNKIEENTAIAIEKALTATEEAIKAYNSATSASNSAALALELKNQTEALKNLMQDKINQIDTNTNRINNLATIDQGSITTTADAELVDIRVGANGTTYPSAGGAVRNQISDLKSALDELGIMQIIICSNRVYRTQNTISKGTEIFIKPINTVTESNVTGLSVYGMYGSADSDGYDNIATVYFGEKKKLVTNRDYHHLQIATYPTNVDYFKFLYLESDNDSLEKKLETYDNDIPKLKIENSFLQERIDCGDYSADHSDIIFEYDNIVIGETYKVFVKNISGGRNSNDPVLYLMKNDGSYIELTDLRQNLSNGFVITYTIPNNAKSLRLYMNKNDDSEFASCEWLLIKYNDSRIDLIEKKVENSYDLFSNVAFASFIKFGVIGDSLSVGYTGNDDQRNIEYSWGRIMARMYGQTCLNFGLTGITTKTWFSDSHCYDELIKNENKCQAYIIGIGTNDIINDSFPIGTTNDINLSDCTLNGNSFYGYYARIIQSVKIINPSAKIFTYTIPYPREDNSKNNAIREISDMFENVFLVDLQGKYNDFYKSTNINGFSNEGHFSPGGYANIAKITMNILSETMKKNASWFTNIDDIPFGEATIVN